MTVLAFWLIWGAVLAIPTVIAVAVTRHNNARECRRLYVNRDVRRARAFLASTWLLLPSERELLGEMIDEGSTR